MAFKTRKEFLRSRSESYSETTNSRHHRIVERGERIFVIFQRDRFAAVNTQLIRTADVQSNDSSRYLTRYVDKSFMYRRDTHNATLKSLSLGLSLNI